MENEKRIAIGQYLFIEGTHYNEWKEKAILSGTHLSFFLHESCGIISIHFREKLGELKNLDLQPIKLMKHFLTNIKTDLNNLATNLQNDERLKKINEIWGLCSLSARWGERHGFKTYEFTNDPELIKLHDLTIEGVPKLDELTIPQPLTLFHHTKESFIREFGPVS